MRRFVRWIAALLASSLLVLSSCASSLLTPAARLRAASPAQAAAAGSSVPEPWSDDETEVPADVSVLPGEYEPVDRVLFGWHAGNWQYVRFFASYLRQVTPDARVLIAVEDQRERTILSASLAGEGVDLSRVGFVIHELDSMWIRDYGPMLVRTRDGGFRVMDLPYHIDRENDDAFPSRFALEERLPVTRPPLDMEGGHIQSDGAGRCVVTDDVLARNDLYDYTEDDVRRVLRQFFGCRHLAIVPALFAEETGHVDVFAYVTGPARVIVGSYTPAQDLVNSPQAEPRRAAPARRGLRGHPHPHAGQPSPPRLPHLHERARAQPHRARPDLPPGAAARAAGAAGVRGRLPGPPHRAHPGGRSDGPRRRAPLHRHRRPPAPPSGARAGEARPIRRAAAPRMSDPPRVARFAPLITCEHASADAPRTSPSAWTTACSARTSPTTAARRRSPRRSPARSTRRSTSGATRGCWSTSTAWRRTPP
ncbi:MAG: agmatine deiminase family protein [Sandaracinaceae bacterium]|nr:agmatine deiminase family protein [Sandaracinaceae bacterium]